jgi:hypothetical protein
VASKPYKAWKTVFALIEGEKNAKIGSVTIDWGDLAVVFLNL